MLGVLIGGACVVLGTVCLVDSAVEKVKDISSSVKNDGVYETAKKETDKFNKFVQKEYERQQKEIERRKKR